jgi:uncharacterized DUF497 family protein
MRFDWDPEKRVENLRKHDIDFVAAVGIFDGPILERHDDRFDYDEIRMAAIGIVDGIEIVVYYTDRGDVRRIFSARKATKHERKVYYQAF